MLYVNAKIFKAFRDGVKTFFVRKRQDFNCAHFCCGIGGSETMQCVNHFFEDI